MRKRRLERHLQFKINQKINRIWKRKSSGRTPSTLSLFFGGGTPSKRVPARDSHERQERKSTVSPQPADVESAGFLLSSLSLRFGNRKHQTKVLRCQAQFSPSSDNRS